MISYTGTTVPITR